MNIFKHATLASLFSLAFLAGCSSEDNSTITKASEDNPTITEASESAASPVDTKIDVVAGCEEITNEDDKAKMLKAKESIIEIYSTFGEGNLSDAQELSASTKETVQTILKKYPGSCEAQLGYVATIVSDIANNKKINDLLDTIYARKGMPKATILSGSVEDASRISVDFTINSSDEIRGILVSDVQSAIASVIPSLDSAISFMTNIANDDNFICSYKIKDRDVELDRGEFAPALAALYVAKASLTAIVSINLNIDNNGSYDWIDSLETIDRTWNYSENAGIKQLVKLAGKDSKLTSIHSSWKSEYRNITNLLDSAITYVQLGLQYGLEEAKNGLATQENDLYVVGNGEFADLSTKDAQKIIDSLSTIREKLRTGFDIRYAEGKTIKFVPYKWFENTDGLLKFLPYHEVNDMSLWNTPDGGFYWSEDLEYQAYAQRYMQSFVAQSYNKYNPEAEYNEIGGWDTDETSGKIHMDIYEPERISAEIGYYADGCKIKFVVRGYQEGYPWNMTVEGDEPTTTTDWTIPDATLPEGMCRVNNGKAEYAIAYRENEVPNILYFTDAKGKKTITIQELVNGKIVDGEVQSYKFEDLRSLIYFPDITLGGVFPNMTEEILWNDIVPAIFGDDDDDDYEEYED